MLHAAKPGDLTLEIRRRDKLAGLIARLQFRNALDVDVELVPELAADRRVGAGIERLVQKRGQQRQRRQSVASSLRNPMREGLQIPEAAGAPIPFRSERVQRDERPPTLLRRRPRPAGRRDDEGFKLVPVCLQHEAVVSERQSGWKLDAFRDPAVAFLGHWVERRELVEAVLAGLDFAALQFEPAADRTVRSTGRQAQMAQG